MSIKISKEEYAQLLKMKRALDQITKEVFVGQGEVVKITKGYEGCRDCKNDCHGDCEGDCHDTCSGDCSSNLR